MTGLSRRRFLGALGACGAVGTAGCSSETASTGDRETNPADDGTATDASPSEQEPSTPPPTDQPATPVEEVTAPTENRNVEVEWQTDVVPDQIKSLGTLSGTVYAGTLANTLHAFDASTGDERWRVELENTVTRITPTADRVYAATGRAVVGVDPTDGTREWHRSVDDHPSQFTVDGKTVYFGDSMGYVYALDASDGTTQWKESPGFTTPDGDLTTFHGDTDVTKPIVDSEFIYTAGKQYVWALNRADGSVHWYQEVETEFASRLVEGDQRFFCGGSPSILTAFDAPSGDLDWTVRPEVGRFASKVPPHLTDGSVYMGVFGEESGGFVESLYRVDRADGTVEQDVLLPGRVTWLASVGGALAATIGGDVYLLDEQTVAPVGYYAVPGGESETRTVRMDDSIVHGSGQNLYRLTPTDSSGTAR